jgi:hypothetical protein
MSRGMGMAEGSEAGSWSRSGLRGERLHGRDSKAAQRPATRSSHDHRRASTRRGLSCRTLQHPDTFTIQETCMRVLTVVLLALALLRSPAFAVSDTEYCDGVGKIAKLYLSS